MASIQIFLSTVSKEFRSYRDALRHDLDRPNVTVKVQEDFIATGTETLDKLDEYIRHCDAVLHLVGDMTGALAEGPSVAAIRRRYPDLAQRIPVLQPCLRADAPALSYTQWEAWLALYHGKTLVIAVPHDKAPRDEQYQLLEDQRAAQQAHLERLSRIERYPEIRFTSADRLAVDMLRSKLQDIVGRAGLVAKPINLPYRSIGESFKGRDALLARLTQAFRDIPRSAAGVVATVLCGSSGVGKTRAALEYAWGRAEDYGALLFVPADSPQALRSNLAALCRQNMLDLPEKVDADESRQVDAVLRWLRRHPGWLMILDNLDSEDDAHAVEALLPQLAGGHVLLTSQLAHWSGGITPLALDVLSIETASELLFARTASKRRSRDDDAAVARTLADALGGLPLALEQAAAYISTRRLTFAQYLADWQNQREDVLTWYDPRLMNCDRSLAMTCQNSYVHLSAGARTLLQRLAWLDAAPIPESLLETAVPGSADLDAFAALAELEGQSLLNRAIDSPTFTVNRLMQQITRRTLSDDPSHAVLTETLRWLDAAYVGDGWDVRTWPVLDPLQPHAQALAARADAAGIAEPTARLKVRTGGLLLGKGRYTEARRLFERAMVIRVERLGREHPDVAECLMGLALLDRFDHAYAKAERRFEIALAIREKVLGPDHPDVAGSLRAIGNLLWQQGDYAKAEPYHLRALAIREAALGPEHPDVAETLENLGALYNMLGDFAKAEPLHERALAIQQKTLGSDHPDLSVTLNNMAYLYVCGQEDNAKALPFFERAVAIQEKALGPEHPDLTRQLHNLAWTWEALGAADKALPLHRRALAIQEKAFGSDHPEVATSLERLASHLELREEPAQALPLLERALAIREKALGPHDAAVAKVLRQLADVHHAAGDRAKAKALRKRADAIQEEAEP